MRIWTLAFMAVVAAALSGCGYNSLQSQDESVKAAWSEVVNHTSGAPISSQTWSTPSRASPYRSSRCSSA